MGPAQLTPIANALVDAIASDAWFATHRIFPNVDFYVALIFHALEFPLDMLPVWTFIPRYGIFNC